MNNGLPEPHRRPGEPPASFPYDRHTASDVMAWAAACPNVYIDGVAYSRTLYSVGIAAKEAIGDAANIVAYRANGAPMDTPPIAEDEEHPVIRESYLRLRAKYASGQGCRPFMPGEPRPTTVDHAAQGGPEWETSCMRGSPPDPSDTPRKLLQRQRRRL